MVSMIIGGGVVIIIRFQRGYVKLRNLALQRYNVRKEQKSWLLEEIIIFISNICQCEIRQGVILCSLCLLRTYTGRQAYTVHSVNIGMIGRILISSTNYMISGTMSHMCVNTAQRNGQIQRVQAAVSFSRVNFLELQQYYSRREDINVK